jgi:hypothetical protein
VTSLTPSTLSPRPTRYLSTQSDAERDRRRQAAATQRAERALGDARQRLTAAQKRRERLKGDD